MSLRLNLVNRVASILIPSYHNVTLDNLRFGGVANKIIIAAAGTHKHVASVRI